MSNLVNKEEDILPNLILQKKDVLISRLKLSGIERGFEDYANDILYAVSKSEDLAKCTPKSIIDAAFQLAKCGLSVGGNIGHLVPFDGKCTFQIGYEGYSVMLSRTVGIKKQMYDVIYNEDTLEQEPQKITVDENGELKSIAKFSLTRGSVQKTLKGAFAYLMLADGNSFFLYMPIEEINKYKPQKVSGSFWGKWDNLMYSKQVYKILARKLCKFYCNTKPEIIEVIGDEENIEIKNVNDVNNEKPKSVFIQNLEADIEKESDVSMETQEVTVSNESPLFENNNI